MCLCGCEIKRERKKEKRECVWCGIHSGCSARSEAAKEEDVRLCVCLWVHQTCVFGPPHPSKKAQRHETCLAEVRVARDLLPVVALICVWHASFEKGQEGSDDGGDPSPHFIASGEQGLIGTHRQM